MSRRFNFGEDDLQALSRDGNLAVLCHEVPADLMTPLGAYLRLAPAPEFSFLLESVEGGTRMARYSFLGADPERVFRLRAGRLTVAARGAGEVTLPGPPLEALRRQRAAVRAVRLPGLPRFTGGLVGHLGYDFVRLLERLPEARPGTPGEPTAVLAEYRTVLAFDHLRNRLLLMSAVDLNGDPGADRRSFNDAAARLTAIGDRLAAPLPLDGSPPAAVTEPGLRVEPADRDFLDSVARAQRHIAAGDLFQVVLSRRFTRPWTASPLPVYRALRSLNPSPYHFLLTGDGRALAGASPEMLVRIEAGRLTMRPIAGTRRRGPDEETDVRLEAELRASAKEWAEHIMLVDLARNDAGRVAQPGSVRVEGLGRIERFSHVMHLVSTVSADLASGRDALDALAACFPAGTVSGAPKIRAMEIIEAEESSPRGPYGGAVAYLDHGGDLDSCIAIRCVEFTNGEARVQAGAGIVADSTPAEELAEIDHKARAMLAALDEAAGRAT